MLAEQAGDVLARTGAALLVARLPQLPASQRLLLQPVASRLRPGGAPVEGRPRDCRQHGFAARGGALKWHWGVCACACCGSAPQLAAAQCGTCPAKISCHHSTLPPRPPQILNMTQLQLRAHVVGGRQRLAACGIPEATIRGFRRARALAW